MLSGTLGSLKTPRALVLIAGSTLALANPVLSTAMANPEGPQVVAGSASFNRVGDLMRITASNNTIINFRSFNILPRETVQFVQPSVNARVLGRITGGAPTLIQGSLLANGQVYLINQAGITFSAGSVVNVGAIYAGAARLSDASFLSGEDRFTNGTGAVRNYGSISGEFVGLLGREVANAGTIIADRGNVVMAAGNDVFISRHGSNVMVRLDTQQLASETVPVPPSDAAGATPRISNTGSIEARGGGVRMLAGDAFGMAVVQSGRVQAQRVDIQGTGNGDVRVSGTIDASDTGAGGRGGSVVVTGQRVIIDNADIDASGDAGGGSVRIGGDYQGGGTLRHSDQTFVTPGSTINADAVSTGQGGSIVLWSDQFTATAGTLTARGGALGGDGGLIETSSRGYLEVAGSKIDAAGRGGGKAGLWLIDPADIEINSTGPTGSGAFTGGTFNPDNVGPANTSTVLDTDINALLAANTSVTVTNVGSTGTGPNGGRIRVDSTASLANTNFGSGGNAATLTLTSAGSIVINGAVASSVPLTLTAAGAITVTSGSFAPRSLSATSTAGSIVMSQALTTIGAQSFSVTGGQSVTLSGAYATTNSSFSVTGAAVLAANTSVSVGSGNVDFTGTITGSAAGRSLTVTSSGVTTFGGNLGSAGTRLGLVSVTPIASVGTTSFNGDSIFASGVSFNQVTTFGGSGSVSIDTSSAAQTLTINGLVLSLPAATALTLTSAGDVSISNGVTASVNGRTSLTINASGRSVVIGGTGIGSATERLTAVTVTAASLDLTGAAAQTTGAQSYTVTSDFTAASLDASTGTIGIAGGATAAVSVTGSIDAGSTVTTAGATISLGSVTSSGSQSHTGVTSTTLGGTYTTGNGNFTVTGPTLLGTDSTVTAGTGDVSFTGSVLSGGTARALTVTGNDVSFGGAIGSATAGQGLTTLSVTGTANGGDTASVTLSTANTSGGISLSGTDVTASGAVTSGSTVAGSGTTLSLRSVSSTGLQSYTGSTSTTLNGTYATGNGNFTVVGPTILGGTTTVNAGSGSVGFTGNITGSAVNRAITVNSGGTTTFGGNLGTAGTRLGQVQVNQVAAVGSTTFQGTSIFATTLGFNQDTTFDNTGAGTVSVNTTNTLTINQLTLNVGASTAVQLTSSSTVSLSNGVTTATDATGELAITATNQQVLVGGSGVGTSGNRLKSVSINGGSVDLTGAAVFTTGNQSFTATSDFTAAGLDSSTGSVTVSGGTTAIVAVTGATTAGTTVTISGDTVTLSDVTSSGAQSHTGATSTTLSGTYLTSNGNFTVTGPAVLGGATTVTAGTGDVSFTGTVLSDGTARDLTITGNDVTFSAGIGSTTAGQRIAALDVTGTASGGDTASVSLTTANTSGAISLVGTDVSAAGAITGGSTVTTSGTTVSLRNVTSTGAQSHTGTTSITLNGTYLTNNGDFTVSGPAVLAADSTVTAGTGDVEFTGTVLSNGTPRALTVTGNDLTFGGDIGSSTAGEKISALTLTGTASGGDTASVALASVFTSGAVLLTGTSVASSGTIGSGSTVTIGGETISLVDVTSVGAQSFTGTTSTTLSGNHNTGNGSFTVAGPAILADSTDIDAGTGDVLFTGSVLSNGTAQLLIVRGNDITFSGAIGSTTLGEELAALTVVGAANGADASTLTLSTVDAAGAIDLTATDIVASATITGGSTVTTNGTTVSLRNVTSSGAQSHTGTTSTTLNGTYVTTDGDFTVTGPAVLAGNTTVTAGTGDVGFTGTVLSNGTARSLTVTGNDMTFGGGLGSTTVGQQLSTLDLTGSDNGGDTSAITLTTAVASGVISLTGTDITASGAVTSSSTVTASGSALSFSSVTSLGSQSFTGTTSTTLSGTYLTNNSSFTVTGPAVLAGNTTVTAGTGDVGFTGSVLSNGTARSLTVTGNDITFGDAIGSSIAGEKIATLSVTGTANGGDAASVSVTSIDTTGVALLQGTDVVATGAITSGSAVIVIGSTLVVSDVTSSGNQAFTASVSTTLNGTYVTNDRNFTVTGPALLGGDSTVTAGAGDVTFGGTVRSDGTARSLTVTGNDVIFGGAIGSATSGQELASLDVTGTADGSDAAGLILAAATASGTISLIADSISASGTINGGSSVTTSGTTISLRDVSSSGNQSHTGTTSTTLSGTYATDGGNFTVTGPALLGGTVTVNAGAGDVSFTGTVASSGGNRTLDITGGNVTFSGAVGSGGAANRLSSLVISGSGTVELAGVTTIVGQTYSGSTVSLGGSSGYLSTGTGSIVIDSDDARLAGTTQSLQTTAGSIRFISSQPLTVEDGTAATIAVGGNGSFMLLRGGAQLGATGSLTLDGRGVTATSANVPIRIGGTGGAAGGTAFGSTGASVSLLGISNPTSTLGASAVFGAFNAAGVASATSGTLSVLLGSGSFSMAPSARVVSLGDLTITAASATLSYVSVLGDLNVNAASITVAGVSSGRTSQADGSVVTYQGAQIVGTNVTFTSVPTVGGSGGARFGATTAVTSAPPGTSVLLTTDQVASAKFLVGTDIFAPAAVGTVASGSDVITSAIAGAVPPSTRFLADDGQDFLSKFSRRTSSGRGVTINAGGK